MAIVLLLYCVQVPLFGAGPLWLKKAWTRIIRFFKRGDRRRWNWTEIEAFLYVGSLPRTADDLRELTVAPHKLVSHCSSTQQADCAWLHSLLTYVPRSQGAVVSLVEPWEIKVSREVLAELDIQWLLLPTPDYSAPRVDDIEEAVAFIDRQVLPRLSAASARLQCLSCASSQPSTVRVDLLA